MRIHGALAGLFMASLTLCAHSGISTRRAGDITTGNDLFIRWQPRASPAEKEALYQAHGLKVVWQSALVPGLVRVESSDNREALHLVEALGRHAQVQYAEPNYRVYRQLQPINGSNEEALPSYASVNDPRFKDQWALNGKYGMGIEKAWEVTKGQKNVSVAVIDTGVDTQHEDLQGQLGVAYDVMAKSDKVGDNHGHGTHCAGVIGAATNNNLGVAGINPHVTIIPIRAVPDTGDETDADLITAFEFAVKQGAKVASCSFGKKQSAKAVGDTIEAAGEKGLLAVVAAGNKSNDLNKVEHYPSHFQTRNMVVVGAISERGNLGYFSNYGIGKVDIAAPGVDILSTTPKNKYHRMTGTSMATPQVAGVAALIYAINPHLTPYQVKEILIKSGKKLPSLEKKITTGIALDALAAVKAVNPE